jgi:hypothetical protein
MRTAATILLYLVRIMFFVQLILGITFWTGNALNLIPAHMLIGLAIVVCLWVSATIAAIARVQVGMVVAGFVWGVIVIALGIDQGSLVPGAAHWTIQVLHLLVGVGAVGLNERLNRSTMGVDHS